MKGDSEPSRPAMNILILAAGYATRLYPLTENRAKPLLDVCGKPMMEWVIDNLAPIEGIEKVYVVTNNKFAADFQAWADGYNVKNPKLAFEIINDNSTSDALDDTLALERLEMIDGRSLAREAEELLDFTCGRHDAGL